MAEDFRGQIAVVTGGGSGIGAAIARALAHRGAQVVIIEARDAAGAGVAAGLRAAGHEAMAHRIDVTDAAAVKALFDDLTDTAGGIDILVNNAGISMGLTIETLTDDEWSRVVDVNLTGPYNCLKAAVPAMKRRGGGAIVNIASLAAHRISFGGTANYTAAKSGILGLTRHAAQELAVHNIRVNAVCPGLTLTPLVEAATTPEERAQMAGVIPAGRLVMPEDIADVVTFLAGPGCRMVTGIDIVVDGGMSLSFGGPYNSYYERRGLPVERQNAMPVSRDAALAELYDASRAPLKS